MESKQFILFALAFVLGCLLTGIFFTLNGVPTGFVIRDTFYTDPAPADTLNESSFFLYTDRLVIKVPNASITSYGNTGSMLPIITNYSHGIRIKPMSESEISVGDIVSFKKENVTFVHRIVEEGSDSEGIFFITKGDSAINPDDVKLRFDDIEWKIVGILY